MKYPSEVRIEKTIDEVIEKFDNVENLSKWQRGFISFEHISGIHSSKSIKPKHPF